MWSKPCDKRSFQRACRTTKSLPRISNDKKASALAYRGYCMAWYSRYDCGFILSRNTFSQSVFTVWEHCYHVCEWNSESGQPNRITAFRGWWLLWVMIMEPWNVRYQSMVTTLDGWLWFFRIWLHYRTNHLSRGNDYQYQSMMLYDTIWPVMGYFDKQLSIPSLISVFPPTMDYYETSIPSICRLFTIWKMLFRSTGPVSYWIFHYLVINIISDRIYAVSILAIPYLDYRHDNRFSYNRAEQLCFRSVISLLYCTADSVIFFVDYSNLDIVTNFKCE